MGRGRIVPQSQPVGKHIIAGAASGWRFANRILKRKDVQDVNDALKPLLNEETVGGGFRFFRNERCAVFTIEVVVE